MLRTGGIAIRKGNGQDFINLYYIIILLCFYTIISTEILQSWYYLYHLVNGCPSYAIGDVDYRAHYN